MSESVVESGRRHSRRKTLLRGVVISWDGSFVIDVLIRNLSVSGAKLVVPDAQSIPQRSYLIVSGRSCALEVVIVRTLGNELGVHFAEMRPLDSLHGPQWQFLRRLIVERLPRSGKLT